MPKNVFVVMALIFTLVVSASAQGTQPLVPSGPPPPAPGWNNSGAWMLPGMGAPTRRPYEDELWRFKVGVKPGHQWLNYKISFPYKSNPDPALQVFAFERMELELRDSNFWIGYLDAEIQPIQNLVLYGIWGGNAPKEYSTVRMDATGVWTRPGDAGNGGNTSSPWYWDTRFQWWTLDVGAVYWVNSTIGIEAGFRTEHIDFQLKAPRNETLETRGGGVDPNGVTIPCDRI